MMMVVMTVVMTMVVVVMLMMMRAAMCVSVLSLIWECMCGGQSQLWVSFIDLHLLSCFCSFFFFLVIVLSLFLR